MQIHLEKANSSHVAELLCWVQAYYKYDDIPFEQETISSCLAELLENSTYGSAWLFKLHDKAVGYAIVTFGFDVEFGGRLGVVTDFYLTEEHRGRGLGAAAFEKLVRAAMDLGLKTLELQAETKNLRAQKFYEKLGFKPLKRIPMAIRIST